MQKHPIKLLTLFIFFIFTLAAFSREKDEYVIKFATASDYPPFIFLKDGELGGFEVELAKEICRKIGAKAEFYDMGFDSLLPSLNAKKVDVVIGGLSPTLERKKNFDFSRGYFIDLVAIIFNKGEDITGIKDLHDKRLGYQYGTIQERWVKQYLPNCRDFVTYDNLNISIESLKLRHIRAMVMSYVVAKKYSDGNLGLTYFIPNLQLEETDIISMAFQKHSPLKERFDNAIKELEESGGLERMKNKAFDGA